MKKTLAALLLAPALGWASSGGVPLDHAPIDLHDKVSLQRGVQVFVNHCLNCHSASAMRYSRLSDLGLTEAQIRDNLVFTGDKVGEPMVSAMKFIHFGSANPKRFFSVCRFRTEKLLPAVS